MAFRVIDPATGRTVKEQPLDSEAELEARVRSAVEARRRWEGWSFEERARVLEALAGLLEDDADRWGRLMASEMGKPLAQGRKEAEKCAWAARYYAEHGAAHLADEPVEVEGARARVVYRPLGVILSIMPWNFPFWQALRFGCPALMAGNAVLLKHAPNVPGCAAALEELWVEAGAPPGLFQAVYTDHEGAGALMARPEIRAVTFTGSTEGGREVAASAGRALKKTVLELGGSDPYLVLADARVEEAARVAARARLVNSGQSCVAAKRFVVVEEVLEAFQEALVAQMRKAVVGPPLASASTVGPLAREDLRDTLHRQVTESVEAGARLLLGGEVPEGRGWYYPPTVLADVRKGMPAADEELFGPVAAILPVGSTEEAVQVANDSPWGLGAAVFTADQALGERLAREELEAGIVSVNESVASDPRLPFGGVKDSGYGRELGRAGILEFVNVKTLRVALEE
ncbi:MAG: NAD-dependent succinate-semialdehyde dehydrogenase [Gemmatimonadales bacterium]|nr:MAG: NAD-dependent succinate-semialdehyde dehydrogenase [Gemmatimonadales bacterium]